MSDADQPLAVQQLGYASVYDGHLLPAFLSLVCVIAFAIGIVDAIQLLFAATLYVMNALGRTSGTTSWNPYNLISIGISVAKVIGAALLFASAVRAMRGGRLYAVQTMSYTLAVVVLLGGIILILIQFIVITRGSFAGAGYRGLVFFQWSFSFLASSTVPAATGYVISKLRCQIGDQ